LGDPHVWATDDKVATKPKDVADNVATTIKKADNVATIRQVSIRDLNKGISAQFRDLPFDVTKNGRVIARVIKP